MKNFLRPAEKSKTTHLSRVTNRLKTTELDNKNIIIFSVCDAVCIQKFYYNKIITYYKFKFRIDNGLIK